jgi:phosphotransferase system enzyme I (PtsI)
MREVKGIAVSPGVAIGRVLVLDNQRRRVARRAIAPERVAEEKARLDRALKASIGELIDVRAKAHAELGDEAAKIFAFHIGMLSDPSLTRPMAAMIENERVAAEFAVQAQLQNLADRFMGLNNSAFATKVDDVNDLSMRVLKHLIGEQESRIAEPGVSEGDEGLIVLASDLTPSQAAGLHRRRVVGFATEAGGKTGHTGIFARAMGIPAVVGVGGARLTEDVSDGERAIIDGQTGVIILHPDQETLDRYQRIKERDRLFRIKLEELAELPCVTQDGVPIDLQGNIEFPQEIANLIAAGASGVGLYRTEYLYLAGDGEPSEEQHFAAYKTCVESLKGRPLTIRTMDLGADKYTQEQSDSPERNPMLGCRSIRYCLANKPMFKRQLRAILRASAIGPVRVMFPLITTPEEFRRAKFFLRDVMEDLADEGVAFDRDLAVGMMVEVPSAALCAAHFTQDAQFFSIGTNDLVQYTLAVDRTNERVAHMYNPANPAVVQLVKTTVAAAKCANVPVSCCGESAGELEQAMLLIGLGLRTLSASSPALPALKRLVRSVTIAQCEAVAEKASSIDSDVAVSSYLRDVTRKIIPEAFDGRSAE